LDNQRDGDTASVDWRLGETITQDEADKLLITQLKKDYLPPLQKITSWNDLTDNQKGAILSFAYNLGANFYNASGFTSISRLLKNPDLWNDAKEVTRIFALYCNPGSTVEAGLRRRRTREAQLWLDPEDWRLKIADRRLQIAD
jgi:GH24 family phage-related lysozyme (muramidase)